MSDISDIATKHLEDAKRTIDASFKYIITILLLIFCSWLFVTEPIFDNARFHYIKKTRYANQRANILSDKALIVTQHKELSRYKEKASRQDTLIRAEIYKVIEDNIPKPFNSILKIAAFDNYGILIIDLTIMIFILYVFSLRRQVIRKISIALRMLKNNGGFNIAHDYNVSMPFWVAPIPKDSTNLKADEFISVVGFKNYRIAKSFLVFLILLLLIFIQLRLCYISFIINSLINWISVIMIFCFIVSLVCLTFWFLPTRLDDTFNVEDKKSKTTRRDFIILLFSFSGGAILSYFSQGIGTILIERIRKPRFVRHKPNKKHSKTFVVENLVHQKLNESNTEEAAQIIYDYLSNPKTNLYSSVRLFDLIILLCFKEKKIYNSKFSDVIKIAGESRIPILDKRIKSWQKSNNKWKILLADKSKTTVWNEIKI